MDCVFQSQQYQLLYTPVVLTIIAELSSDRMGIRSSRNGIATLESNIVPAKTRATVDKRPMRTRTRGDRSFPRAPFFFEKKKWLNSRSIHNIRYSTYWLSEATFAMTATRTSRFLDARRVDLLQMTRR